MDESPFLEYKLRKSSIKMLRISKSFSRYSERRPSPEMIKILKEEGTHFTLDRMFKIISISILMFLTNMVINASIGVFYKLIAFAGFTIYCIASTVINANHIRNIH